MNGSMSIHAKPVRVRRAATEGPRYAFVRIGGVRTRALVQHVSPQTMSAGVAGTAPDHRRERKARRRRRMRLRKLRGWH